VRVQGRKVSSSEGPPGLIRWIRSIVVFVSCFFERKVAKEDLCMIPKLYCLWIV
jgi:hypothetical protein